MRSSWLCVDASLVVRLVADPVAHQVHQLWEDWAAERRPLAAPTLLYYEVVQALHRYRNLGVLAGSSVQPALKAALALPLRTFDETDLHGPALDLAARYALPTVHAGYYLALAGWLGGELWTADRGLARATQPALPWVHLVGGQVGNE
jgi:predicted nucleic acid-binding protein